MPSYRITIAVGALAPSVAPQDVLPIASGLAAARSVVEARDIRLVQREPRIVVRYEAADDGDAMDVAEHVRTGLEPRAGVRSLDVTRRDGGRWTPVA